MGIVVLGIDLGKNSCSLVGLDASGRVVLRRRLRRGSVESFVGGLEHCIVAMEACCGAHHLGRVFAAQGHTVRLMSPEYVRHVKAQKNDELVVRRNYRIPYWDDACDNARCARGSISR
jgi:transposase